MLIGFKQKLSRSKMFNKIMQFFLPQFLALHPLKSIMIEPTNFCNLRCLFCSQSKSKRVKGIMKIEEFRKIISLLPASVEEIQTHFAGESTINNDLPLMIAELSKREVRIILSTNGNMPFDVYKKIINAGLDEMIFSMDGATKESYEKYRQRGNFDLIVDNIRKVSAMSRKTKIALQFIVMKHNESEIELMKKLACDLGVDELRFKSASLNIGCTDVLEENIIKNAELFLPKNEKYSRYVLKDGKLINKDQPISCPWIFRTVVLWNGDIAVCCVDLEGEIIVGNVLKEGSFEKIWKSKKYNAIRKAILRRELQICKNCNLGDNPIKEVIKYSDKK